MESRRELFKFDVRHLIRSGPKENCISVQDSFSKQIRIWSYPSFVRKRYPATCIDARGVLPYMGYIGMCGPKGYAFSAVLVINWVSIFSHFAAILVIKGIDFCTLVFNLGFLLEKATFSSHPPSPLRALPSSQRFVA